MAIVEVHPERIDGPWAEGFVLDRHVVSSRPIGYLGEHMQFETTRSPLGELVYQLKYRNGRLNDIIETAVAFITKRWSGLVDCVVPPPPSLHRTKQPAVLIAEGVATSLGVPSLASAAIKTTATPQMKNVPLHERAPLLSAAIQAGTDVFVAGSRQISRLPAEVKTRLDTMVEKGFQILVGDANGADKAVQRYLADKSYPNVLVHCMKDHCRNNVGGWPTRQLVAPHGARGFEYYSIKDRAMAEAAEYGLMLWDGKSKGTVNNVVNLSRDHKPVVVYVAPTRQFRTIKSFDDLKDLLAQGDSDSVERIVSELHLNDVPQRAAG